MIFTSLFRSFTFLFTHGICSDRPSWHESSDNLPIFTMLPPSIGFKLKYLHSSIESLFTQIELSLGIHFKMFRHFSLLIDSKADMIHKYDKSDNLQLLKMFA